MKRHLLNRIRPWAIVLGVLALMSLAASRGYAQAFGLPAMSQETKACIDCHKAENNAIYQQWGSSKHYPRQCGLL